MDNLISYDEFLYERKYNGPKTETEIKDSIQRMHKMPDELKDVAIKHITDLTRKYPGRITGLRLHADLKKKIKEKDLPNGFHMGIDKNGYYVHTHRARSKSFAEPGKIGVKQIRFVDSTG